MDLSVLLSTSVGKNGLELYKLCISLLIREYGGTDPSSSVRVLLDLFN
jgi:hypothetical protein